MPAHSDKYLFELIKSLTKQEKADINQSAFKGKGDSIYLKVYKLLDKAEQYDEKDVIRRSGINKARLPEIKNYLSKIILKSLETIHGNNIDEIGSLRSLSLILVLKYKGLFDQCLKRINLALKKAIEKEDYIIVLYLLELKAEIDGRYAGSINSERHLQESFNEFIYYTRHFTELGYYKFLMWKSFLPVSIYEKRPFEISFDAASENTGTLAGIKPDTFLKQILSMASQCRLAILKKDHAGTIEISSKAMAIINNSPKKNILPAYLGYGFINANMLACLSTGEYARAFQSLDKIESFLRSTGSEYQNNLDLYYFNINKMSLYAASLNFDKVIALGNSYFLKDEHLLEKFPESYNLFSYLMGYGYFMMGDVKKANKHLSDLLNLPNDRILRMDFFLKAQFIDLLITLEKGNIKLAENKLRTYERLLKNNKYYDEYEKVMVAFLKRYLHSVPERKFFNEQRDIVEEKLKRLPNYFYHRRYFDFINWLGIKERTFRS